MQKHHDLASGHLV